MSRLIHNLDHKVLTVVRALDHRFQLVYPILIARDDQAWTLQRFSVLYPEEHEVAIVVQRTSPVVRLAERVLVTFHKIVYHRSIRPRYEHLLLQDVGIAFFQDTLRIVLHLHFR